MTDLVFDVALEKRFTESGEIALIDVTSADMLLIRNNETGVVMRIAFSTLSSAVMAALSGSDIISKLGYTPENSANKGNANGYAGLDSSGKVPASQLPSFVDDVLEYPNTGAFPATGETGKIYVALNTNKTYRWSGSAYVEISASPGSTDAVPEGATNLYFTNARASAAAPVQSVAGRTGTVTLSKSDVGLSNVNNTADADKPISTAQQAALNNKADISTGSFTPILKFGGNNTGMSINGTNGRYVKIGSMVVFRIFIQIGLVGSSTGVATVENLPFTSTNNNSDINTFAAILQNSLNLTGAPIGLLIENSNVISLHQTSASGLSALTNSNFQTYSNNNIIISGTYEAQ